MGGGEGRDEEAKAQAEGRETEAKGEDLAERLPLLTKHKEGEAHTRCTRHTGPRKPSHEVGQVLLVLRSHHFVCLFPHRTPPPQQSQDVCRFDSDVDVDVDDS